VNAVEMLGKIGDKEKMIIIRNSFLLWICLQSFWPAPLGAQSVDPQKPHGVITVSAPPSAGAPPRDYDRALSQNLSAEPGLTLEQLQQMALLANPTLAQAQAGVQAAAGRTKQAGLWPNPTVGYSSEEVRGGSFGGGQQGAFIQQNVILGGKLALERKIFAAEGKQAEAEAREQRLRVENGVRSAFYQALAAQQLVETRKRLGELANDAVQTTEQLFNIGQADRPDVLQSQVEADQADLDVITAEQQQQKIWLVLAATVGKPGLSLTRLEGNLEDLPQLDTDQVIQAILRDSPAVQIAQIGVTRADVAVARARREVVPDLLLRAGVRDDLEQLGPSSPTTVGFVGFAEAGVNLRLFNRNQGNIEAAKADRERAQLEVQRVSLDLRQSAAPFIQNYATARAIADRYKKRTLQNAQRAYELYLEKYREGAAAYPEVLIAQRTLFQLQTSYISALENVWMNSITLQGLLLTGSLDAPAGPDMHHTPLEELNMPSSGNR
jgi:cobalt-zinc-cadmium efflux system outer membrane protein